MYIAFSMLSSSGVCKSRFREELVLSYREASMKEKQQDVRIKTIVILADGKPMPVLDSVESLDAQTGAKDGASSLLSSADSNGRV